MDYRALRIIFLLFTISFSDEPMIIDYFMLMRSAVEFFEKAKLIIFFIINQEQ